MIFKTRRSRGCFSICAALVALTSCQENAVKDNRIKTGSRGAASGDAAASQSSDAKYLLTWSGDPGSTITAYHVFYNKGVASNMGGEEIDSLNAKQHDLTQPEIQIDKTNVASFPPRGSSICFYVVAENDGIMSDPSDPICLKI